MIQWVLLFFHEKLKLNYKQNCSNVFMMSNIFMKDEISSI